MMDKTKDEDNQNADGYACGVCQEINPREGIAKRQVANRSTANRIDPRRLQSWLSSTKYEMHKAGMAALRIEPVGFNTSKPKEIISAHITSPG